MSRGRGRLSAAIALCGALIAGCGDDPDPPSIFELPNSAVGIVASGCGLAEQTGSGVVVESPGQVVTVAHTIRGASAVTVVDARGGEHAASVVAFDKDSDLAVLDAPTIDAPPLAIGDVALGSGHVLVWSRDGGAEAKPVEVVKRLRITIEDIYVDEIVQRTGLEIAGAIEIGDSGGPVVTPGGDVIGIVYANSRERDAVGFATDGAELRAVLAARSPTPVPNGVC